MVKKGTKSSSLSWYILGNDHTQCLFSVWYFEPHRPIKRRNVGGFRFVHIKDLERKMNYILKQY